MIFYLNNYYDSTINREPLLSLAMNNKINYFIDILKKNNLEYKNISFGFTKNKGFFRKKISGENLEYLSTINLKEKEGYNLISIFYLYIVLTIYILRNVKSTDKVILYHNPWIYPVIAFCKSIKKFTLILEIEEICYLDKTNNSLKNKIYNYMENKIFSITDRFIVVNDLVKKYVKDKFKVLDESIVVCYGNYSLVKGVLNNTLDEKEIINLEPIKIVYSGSIDKVRGVYDIINISDEIKNLNCNIYVCGYGTKEEIDEFKNRLEKKESKNIKFLGALNNDDYYSLLESCDICLNCQYDFDAFSRYSFPSKIINYLAFNKCVISTEMESVKYSKIGDLIIYYKSNNLKTLVDKIEEFSNDRKKINLLNKTISHRMNELKVFTEKEIIELLQGDN